MSIQRVSSCSSTTSRSWKYDVFISFRGEDTRKNFADHLYTALTREGINVFRDDKELERGKPISPELLQAIEQSIFSIIIFSKNYASSTWCLDEIVKIVECRNTMEQNVFPIFYDVHPTVVRKQTGVFRDAFAKHEEAFKDNKQKVQNWRNALIEVANLSGWDATDRYESNLIHEVVQEISKKLSPTKLRSCEDLIGISSRLEKLRLHMGMGVNKVCMTGIWGMGGIGKTTIARAFYELESRHFEGSCFLANVRDVSEKEGLVSLQRQLLYQILKRQESNIFNEYDGMNEIQNKFRCKNIRVVIDDVVHLEQLKKLAENHDWFGLGSRIIITTRDKHLLKTHGVDEIYEAEKLNHNEALQLLISKAFKNHRPQEDYKNLPELVVSYAGGLPLALEVLGSSLFGRNKDEWKDAIERLKRNSEKGILDKLQITFDDLEETEKKIFLDIACFFKGENREYVGGILDACGFNPVIGISVLIEKSLIKIDNCNHLWMHDLLQEMGRQIIMGESLDEPGKRSRLWDEEDIRHVLTKNTGTNRVEAIVLEKELHLRVRGKAFSKLTNLRLLKIPKVKLSGSLDYLSNELRFLDWDGYNLKSLPSNLHLDKLVEFKMTCSRVGQLWKGSKHFNMLKSISFKDCNSLTRAPDLSGTPNLEKLSLERCPKLSEIGPSLLVHKKIKWINLADCLSLKTLPSKIHMESLQRLVLSGCSKLKKFPEIFGSMECLREICLDETAIKELPSSVGLLGGLKTLNLAWCENLLCLPSTIDGLKSLEKLDLYNCSELVGLPNTLNGLSSLRFLLLDGCSKLENVPETLWQVESLRCLDLCITAMRPPRVLHSDGGLRVFWKYRHRGAPSKSSSKKSSNPMASFISPSFATNLSSLTYLSLFCCNLEEGAIPSDFFVSLISLSKLDLGGNNFVSLPTSINRLSKLRELSLKYCSQLQNLPELPSNLHNLVLDGCVALETLSNALRLCNSSLSRISCEYCSKLIDGVPFSMLDEQLKRGSSHEFSIITPGSEIPDWFKHRSEGPSVTIKKPPDFYNDSKLAGFVVCCVLTVNNHSSRQTLYPKWARRLCYEERDQYMTLTMSWPISDGLTLPTDGLIFLDFCFGHGVDSQVVSLPKSDHLCFCYLTHPEGKFKFKETELYATSFFCEVKKCGVRPVYKQEGFIPEDAITI